MPTKPAGSLLDDMIANPRGGDARAAASAGHGSPGAIRSLHEVDTSATTSTLVPGEKDETTYTALAELYDGKRDRAVEALAGVVNMYGEAVTKRGTAMTAAVAAPMLAEMRKWLDQADAAQAKATSHRAAI